MPGSHHPFIPSGLPLCSEHPALLALPSPLCSSLPAGPTLFLGLPWSAWQGNPLPSLLIFLPRTNQTPLLCQDAPWDPGRGKDHAQIMKLLEFSSLTLGLWLQTPIVRKHQSSLSFHGWDSTLTSSGLLFFEGLYILHGDSMGCQY